MIPEWVWVLGVRIFAVALLALTLVGVLVSAIEAWIRGDE